MSSSRRVSTRELPPGTTGRAAAQPGVEVRPAQVTANATGWPGISVRRSGLPALPQSLLDQSLSLPSPLQTTISCRDASRSRTQGWGLVFVTTRRRTGRSPTLWVGWSISAVTPVIAFVQGTGPVGGTATGVATGAARGVRSGWSCSDVAPRAPGAVGGGTAAGGGGAALLPVATPGAGPVAPPGAAPPVGTPAAAGAGWGPGAGAPAGVVGPAVPGPAVPGPGVPAAGVPAAGLPAGVPAAGVPAAG